MKALKSVIISAVIYLVFSSVFVLSINYYVNSKYDNDAKLWEKYEAGMKDLKEKINLFKFSIEDEKEYRYIFEKKYGKDMYWYQYQKGNYPDVLRSRDLAFSIYEYVITPAWVLLTLLFFLVRNGWFTTFRIKSIIVWIALLWITLTSYLPALFGADLHLANILARILVPIIIAVGAIYLIDLRKNN